jgi:predicted CXXCH cytochrome family protein
MSDSPVEKSPTMRSRHAALRWISGVVAVIVIAVVVVTLTLRPSELLESRPARLVHMKPPPHRLVATPRLSVWWDEIPSGLGVSSQPDGVSTNIHPADYVGPDACRACHPKNHADWSDHPHRFMNALATPEMVRGDFGGTELKYKGGTATFSTGGGQYRMTLARDGRERVYQVSQTIGSRFFQYYIGKQIAGPEPPDHHFYHRDHVLPFGYWIDQQEWVPTVHIGPEQPDADRPDPFDPPESGRHYANYAASCNYCHTTFPLGDLLARRPHQMGRHARVRLDWSVRGYLIEARPQELPAMEQLVKGPAATPLASPMAEWDAPHYAATLGISCEACHLGGRAHVESKGRTLPRFFPASPHLLVESSSLPSGGPTHDNLNWACGRCHTGSRPAFAAGMSTWNSVEYSDAMFGSCYSQLRCVDCHNPHQAIGKKWSRPPEADDAVCVKCHAKFAEPSPRLAHTHHPAGSEGDRCLNCHMPRINEGLQDVIRTHMIYSPTRAEMLEANHPNACNLCHTNEPIDWTLDKLKDWWGKSFDYQKIAASYPNRETPVAMSWLASENESVRLVGVDAMARSCDKAAIPRLLDALDDPFLLNRQFAMKRLQDAFGIRASDFEYRYYLSAIERRDPLTAMRDKVAPGTIPITPPEPRPTRRNEPGTDPR